MARKKISRVGKAGRKMTLIISYYVLLGSIGLINFSYVEVSNVGKRIGEEFLCQSTGTLDCDDDNLYSFHVVNFLQVLTVSMVNFYPVVIILFTFDPQSCKKFMQSVVS